MVRIALEQAALYIARLEFEVSPGTSVSIRPPTAPTANAGGSANFNGFTVSLAGSGSQQLLPHTNQKTLAHEYFHVHQLQAGWRSPTWFLEGAAEFVGYQVLIENDLIPQSRVLACEMQIASSNQMPPLSELERNSAFQAARGGYALGYLAVAKLTANGANVSSLATFAHLSASQSFDAAFHSAFGVTPPDFYASFEAERASFAQGGQGC